MVSFTETFVSGSLDDVASVDWVLIVALDCERLTSPPLRIALAGYFTVELGRGARREVRANRRQVRVDLPDRWASRAHARLSRQGDGWVLEDAGSKNGTRVNGERVERAELTDGNIIEIGGNFLVLRRATAVTSTGGPAQAGGMATLSPAFEAELAVLAKIALSRVPVLVRGESGSGKEVIASVVHALSGRRGPLQPVNCGAIPAGLLEGELFGSRRGAFTGAEDRTGLVRSADQGTLFLDELVELPASSQAALLRFLQDGEITPLGADKRIFVDVRVVAATNQPIEALVTQGRFRRDLYARLCGHVVHLPPLHARMEDLGLLVTSLLARLEPEGTARRLSRAAGRALFGHRWPLNVRELEQVLRSALATADGPEIAASDLRLATEPIGLDAAPPCPTPARDPRERIVTLLVQRAGNVTAVARELATSPAQVRRLLARYGLAAADYKR